MALAITLMTLRLARRSKSLLRYAGSRVLSLARRGQEQSQAIYSHIAIWALVITSILGTPPLALERQANLLYLRRNGLVNNAATSSALETMGLDTTRMFERALELDSRQ
jgi:hypothetical protein